MASKRRRKATPNGLAIVATLVVIAGHLYLCHAFVPTIRRKANLAATSSRGQSFELDLFRSLDRVQEEQVNGERTNGEVNVNGHNNRETGKVPFIIERLGERPRDEVFKGIAEMCIAVFFNNGKEGRAMPPWKEVQLSYLRMIQMADLRRRRARDKKTNAMFVAFKVEEAARNAAQSQPLIFNLREVHNLNGGDPSADYVRGEILGFCEVSMVPFGLAPTAPPLPNGYIYDDGDDNINSRRLVPKRMRNADVPRPVLTNLSVKMEARSSGVGSKLLEACERTASGEFGKSEIVLEVENDNIAARTWYQKRGYRVLFSDPSSRRYDWFPSPPKHPLTWAKFLGD